MGGGASAGTRHGQHRFDDLRVAGTAAEIAGEGLAHVVLGGRGIRGEQRARGEQHARRAEAALGRARAGKGALKPVRLAIVFQALGGEEGPSAEPGGENEARADGLAVEEHGAGAADALATAILGRGEGEAIAEKIENRPVGGSLRAAGTVVEGEVEPHLSPPYPLSTRLAAVPLSSHLTASPFSSNCHACGINSALVSRRPMAAPHLERRAASRLERRPSPRWGRGIL